MASKGAEWVAGYVAAWESNDPEQIGALFTDDAVYLTAPDVEPRRGREAIVAGWLEDLDEPGTWSFDWKIVDEHDDFVVVQEQSLAAWGSLVKSSVETPGSWTRAGAR